MTKRRGFALVEMAIVLLIMGLLLGGLIAPLAAQIESRRFRETEGALLEIKEALIGYALANGKLPCPTTQTDPANALYGVAPAACASPVAEGYIPWKTLGVSEFDAWGLKRTSVAAPFLGYWRYRVHRSFTVPFDLNTVATTTDNLLVRDNAGNAVSAPADPPVAIFFSTGKNLTADGQNTSYEATNGIYQMDVPSATFDDITKTLSRLVLFNRLVLAQKLP
jgi:prepilin-type N-terminal cleavage/methylation domain-containing protein